jgi:hypothetical protein
VIITNRTDIPLALAVWLLHDEYDFINAPNYISATTLMKPIRQIVLPGRIPLDEQSMDVSELIASALGKSLHDSIEKSWVKGYRRSLKLLGYPDNVINRVLVNPEPAQIKPDSIQIWIEHRAIRKFNGFTIGGKFDLCTEGILQDNKSTSVYAWIKGSKDDDYRLQGSLYKWLNPDKVTEDFIRINFIFTDWQKAKAKWDPTYPQSRLQHRDVTLWSPQETETWIRRKLDLIKKYRDVPEEQIPECTDEELWRSDPQFKFYSDPAKANIPGARATRNFDTMAEARQFQTEKGGKGAIKTVLGEVQRCNYCNAFSICKQKDKYFHD